jgi:hypothetical protein
VVELVSAITTTLPPPPRPLTHFTDSLTRSLTSLTHSHSLTEDALVCGPITATRPPVVKGKPRLSSFCSSTMDSRVACRGGGGGGDGGGGGGGSGDDRE